MSFVKKEIKEVLIGELKKKRCKNDRVLNRRKKNDVTFDWFGDLEVRKDIWLKFKVE